jgi:sn-glycerol 3-phosphate transport system permease protein
VERLRSGLSAHRAVKLSPPRWLPAAVLLGPSLAFLAGFTYWPVMRIVVGSVMVGRFAGRTTIGFGNYQRLFADPHFARAAWNNLAYAVGTIGPSLVLALGLVLALRETKWLRCAVRP